MPRGGSRVWDYELAVGYRWDPDQGHWSLDVNLNGLETTIQYQPDIIHDVAVEIYALRPCAGHGVRHVMAQELNQIHNKVYNMFSRVDQPAIHDSQQLLSTIEGTSLDESKMVPLLDITSFQVFQVTIRHVLDYVYYKDPTRNEIW